MVKEFQSSPRFISEANRAVPDQHEGARVSSHALLTKRGEPPSFIRFDTSERVSVNASFIKLTGALAGTFSDTT